MIENIPPKGTWDDSFTDDYFCTGEDYIKSYGCGEFYEGYRS